MPPRFYRHAVTPRSVIRQHEDATVYKDKKSVMREGRRAAEAVLRQAARDKRYVYMAAEAPRRKGE